MDKGINFGPASQTIDCQMWSIVFATTIYLSNFTNVFSGIS